MCQGLLLEILLSLNSLSGRNGQMVNKKKPEGFKSAQGTAEEFAKDREKTGHLLEEAIAKAGRNRKVLEKVWENLQALMRLVKAWVNGSYTEVPWKTIIYAIAAIVYFVNPFDVMPDFIPGAGFLDDAGIIAFVVNSIKNHIELFKEWERANI